MGGGVPAHVPSLGTRLLVVQVDAVALRLGPGVVLATLVPAPAPSSAKVPVVAARSTRAGVVAGLRARSSTSVQVAIEVRGTPVRLTASALRRTAGLHP